MAVKLSVGLQKKVGLPDYGSLGASCYVEFEIDGSLLSNDQEGFQQKVRGAFIACHQAVADELARNQNGKPATHGNGHSNGNGNGNGHRRRDNTRKATASQVRALHAIADRNSINLAGVLQERFGTHQAEDLSITEASGLIDELKVAANGNGHGGNR
jgi:hypothetical protein